MSVVPLRANDLLASLRSRGLSPDGAGPSHCVGLRGATPRNKRHTPGGPRLSAKKRTPSRRRTPHTPRSIRQTATSEEAVPRLTPNSIIREFRERDTKPLTPLDYRRSLFTNEDDFKAPKAVAFENDRSITDNRLFVKDLSMDDFAVPADSFRNRSNSNLSNVREDSLSAPKAHIKYPTVFSRETRPPSTRDASTQCELTFGNFGTFNIKGKRYMSLGVLGQGGSSQVFKVMDDDSKMYAVKCVDLGNDAYTQCYINEIKLLRKLQGSDRVVTMFDYDCIRSEKKLLVLLELGDVDLSALLKSYRSRGSNLPIPILVGYWTEMLTAVGHIHDNGIIHSDLKPANFLLVHGRLKLIDFGIASSLNSDATSVLKTVTTGTLNYISPEAITLNGTGGDTAKITYKSDTWSLGCILYSMLYGRPPFGHIGNLSAKIAALCDSKHTINYPEINGVPPVLTEAMRRCLTFDPKLRMSVRELIDLPYTGCGCTSAPKSRIPLQTVLKMKAVLTDSEWQTVADALEGLSGRL